MATPYQATSVAVSGNFAYVTDRDPDPFRREHSLQVVDVTNPRNPTIIGSVPLQDAPSEVAVVGSTAYVAAGNAGLLVVDVTDPTSPVVVGSVPPAASHGYLDLAVVDKTAYMAGFPLDCRYCPGSIEVIDVTDPVNPAIVGTVVLQNRGRPFEVAVVGDYAYVPTQTESSLDGELRVFDVRDPTNPVKVGSVDTYPYTPADVAVVGNIAYVTAGGVTVIDVTDPSNPTYVSRVETRCPSGRIVAYSDTLYMGGCVLDITSPNNPTVIGGVSGFPAGVPLFAVDDDIAYVTTDTGLSTIDVSDRTTPLNGRVGAPGVSTNVVIVDGLAYLSYGDSAPFEADEDSGLLIADISDPASPQAIASINVLGYAEDVAVAGNTAYLAIQEQGLQVIDVTDPMNPTALGFMDTPGWPQGITTVGNVAYVADGDSGLQVVDITDPTNPAIIGSVDTPFWALRVAVVDGLAYVADQSAGVQVIDVTDPANPAIIHTIEPVGRSYGVAIVNDTLYVADGYEGGLQIIDVADPTTPVVLGSVNLLNTAWDVAVADNIAYVAAFDGGMYAVDVFDPTNPVVVDNLGLPRDVERVAVAGNQIYVVEYLFGLQLVPAVLESPTTWISDTQLELLVPNHLPADTYHVTVLNPDGAIHKAYNSLSVFEESDSDGDGLLDHVDNCPFEFNPDQLDTELDGIGNACDDDDDNDGIPDVDDGFPLGFADVPDGAFAFSFIEAMALSGVTAGCGNGNYCPSDPVTRAQMAVFLERGINGSSFVPPSASGTVFNDVGASDFAAAFIEQLFADGITGGCGGGNYCPDDSVTRAQMAVFLLRAKYGSGYAPPDPTGVFDDVPIGSFADRWIEQLAVEGITAGCGAGNYCPDDPVTRAQMAVFLVRTFEL